MEDRLRSLGCHLLVIAILGGLWVYADLQRRIGEAPYYLPAPDRPSVRRVAEGQQPREAQPATRPVAGQAVSDLGLLLEVP